MDKPFKQIISLKSAQNLRQYLENNGNLNLSLMKDNNQATLLHYAAFKNDLVKLKIYFQHYKAYCEITHGTKMYEAGFQSKVKAWINKPNNQGLTALHFAALHGNIQIIKILQELGANMQFKTKQEQNVLFMAVQNNQIKTLIYLLQQSNNKLDINDKNNIGDNILHKAARNGYIGISAYLLTTNINVNQQNEQGFTPLMEAVLCKNKQIVKNMLLKGVDRTIKNKIQQRAIDIAKSQQHQQLINILNDEFTFGQKLKIACNVKIVYRVQNSSYLYAFFFIVLYNIAFLPTCIITQFTNLPSDRFYLPIIGQGVYYLLTNIFFLLLLRKPQKKTPLPSLMNLQLPFCAECRNQKRNQFHCFICDTCIYRYDHHCPWINNCIGSRNIGKFYAFLWLIQLGTLFVIVCHACMLGLAQNLIRYREFTNLDPQQKALSVLCLIIGSFFGVSIFLIIIQQTKNLCTNTTQFQRNKKSKAKSSKITSKSPNQTLLSSQDNAQSQSFVATVDEQQAEQVGCIGNCSKMLCSKE